MKGERNADAKADAPAAARADTNPNPDAQEAAKADAIVVLGGRPNRVPVGLRLWRDGFAPILVVFNASGEGDDEHLYVRPEPYTTRGEARSTARLAREHGWGSIVLVTSSYHVPRARMLFRRAFDGEVLTVGAQPTLWRLPFDLLSELVKALYALTLRRSP
jgi:uncharacterized SAM-binding protein YcdF (DUF218 family)